MKTKPNCRTDDLLLGRRWPRWHCANLLLILPMIGPCALFATVRYVNVSNPSPTPPVSVSLTG